MAKRNKTTAEKGKFKEEIHTALFKSENIRELLLGDTTGMSASKVRAEFKNHVMSHLFIKQANNTRGFSHGMNWQE